jgi:hypothetical protein
MVEYRHIGLEWKTTPWQWLQFHKLRHRTLI